ncbi:MAG: hypothetical protein F2663_01105 [Actinobacteria bacterium]|uniref:Unannotated protein n=1 Tax=freshwater metagenome TaxID=449393 RepID=A0A6J6NFI9_9ZZZZ|nr:hypothetical protein [Actinomycetota bacterium]
MHRLCRLIPLGVVAAIAVMLVTGCGGSSSSSFPTIGAAKTYSIADFAPAVVPVAGKPTTVSFGIEQPDGALMKKFKTGSGPHTGIHLIFVRSDLGYLIHVHPPVGADGKLAIPVTFPAPGRYRVVVDVYPADARTQPNFQLFRTITVRGAAAPTVLPAPGGSVTVSGYRFTMEHAAKLKAIQAGYLKIAVTGPDGKPATITPWLGALAHAIFFRKGTLDYFHTHVCAPGADGCTSILGGANVTGKQTTPGVLDVGVLVPAGGTWRLFLQCEIDGHVLTAPFTIPVTP